MKISRKNYRNIILVVLFMIVCLFMVSCSLLKEPDPTPRPLPQLPPTYSVARETGFYGYTVKNGETYIDEDYKFTINEGARVKPADSKTSLECGIVSPGGVEITLCKVEVIGSGEIGYVIKNALARE